MNLSKEYKAKIEQEFEFVINKMEKSQTPDQMLYYFSGIQTLLNRIINFEYTEDLLFSYFVLEKVHKEIVGALGGIKQGNPIVTFHEKFADKLVELTRELRDGFFNSNTRIEALKKIAVLTYTCTGNGFFLTEKGTIDIFSGGKKLREMIE